MATKTSTLAVRLIDGISGPAKGAAASLKQVEAATANLAKVRGFREQTTKLNEMVEAHRRAREHIKNLGSALMAAENPSNRMKAAYERATAAADKLGNRIEWQRARVRGAASEIERMGSSVNHLAAAEMRARADIDRTTAALRRQEAAAARTTRRREAFAQIGAGAGVVTAYRGREIGRKAIVSAAEFDIGTRKQREFAEITEAEQAGLRRQATKIGQDTQFSNLDVVKAQTKAMTGLPSHITGRLKAEVAEGILENVKNYALVMEADLETSAEAIRSYLQATGKDISTKEKALAEANKATNQLVRMAKLGGMSDEDVQGYLKFAGSPGTAAGLTPESMMSLGALARRGGLRGDEAGVFVRSMASKLVSPTKKGRAALAAAGIDFDSYRTPAQVGVENLETQFRNDHGKGFSERARRKLAEITANPALMGDRGKFIEAVTEATAQEFSKSKGGRVLRTDRNRVAKTAGVAYDAAGGKVDTERLLDDAMSKNMTLAQLNAWLTDKHGGKGAITQRQWDEFKSSRAEIRQSGNDPDYAKKKADEIMGGLGGSLERLTGSVENFYLAIGQANEKILTLGFDKLGNSIDAISNMSEPARQAAGAIGTLAVAGAGAWGTLRLMGAIMGAGGAGAALTGSAAALTASAAALDAAAVALAGGKVAQAVTGGVGAAAVAGGTGAAGGIVSTLKAVPKVPLMVGIGLAGYGISTIGEGNRKLYENVEPGQPHNEGQRRRRGFHERLRMETEAVRQETEKLGSTGESAGTEAGQKAGAGVAAGITNSGPAVDAAAQGIMARMKTLFGAGVDVPVRVQGSASPAAGPMAPPASTPAPNKQSSIGTINIKVQTGEGDPRKIAQAISRELADEVTASSHGAFSDYS